ncbi:nitronate monooxygenase [Sphingomonas panacisoli]|uniref:Propionate 3-nitronate monooxygenase n=1 Tax=Sphingomonas panacisoli TaxID=1813879 RepID=A0A5B8LF79_9SPHN|nr:nitronate monooxygenase family protein [Sphingomonas panacisoli]QDZ06596.1 nitronate monooxygenase [Sphingomonas panacisoli]
MTGWPDRRFLDLTGAAVPIVQAPMAGASGVELAVAAMRGGAVGSLPCAMLTPIQVIVQAAEVRADADGPLNLNFFCHRLGPAPDDTAWREVLKPFYALEGVEPGSPPPLRRPFDAAMAEAVEAVRPEIVSFHFGLPSPDLIERVLATGAAIVGNATTPAEVRWLAEAEVDAIVLQGAEAGGHAGWFLGRHQPTPLADLLQVAVDVPTIAAGGIVDAADMAAALSAGASAVQLGTAYLASPESNASAPHRALLGTATETVFTNLFSGGVARGLRNRLIDAIGPINPTAPPFPYASAALAPLRAKAEADGRGDYSPLWAGTGAARVQPEPAETLTCRLAAETLARLETA